MVATDDLALEGIPGGLGLRGKAGLRRAKPFFTVEFFRSSRVIGCRKSISDTDMHKCEFVTKVTLTISADARDDLRRWAERNLTTMSAEMVRAIRERAQREHKERNTGMVG